MCFCVYYPVAASLSLEAAAPLDSQIERENKRKRLRFDEWTDILNIVLLHYCPDALPLHFSDV